MTDKKLEIPSSPAIKNKLEKLGLRNLQDVALHLPHRYDDETSVVNIRDAQVGEVVQIEGTVVASKVIYRPRRILNVVIEDHSAAVNIKFFNFYGSQVKTLVSGARIRAIGEVRVFNTGFELIHPRYKIVEEGTPLPKYLTPIYPTGAGVRQPTLRRLVKIALEKISTQDTLSLEIRQKYNLMKYSEALSVLHSPPKIIDKNALSTRKHPAWYRLKFDELLAQQLILKMQRKEKNKLRSLAFPKEKKFSERLKKNLSFSLTESQRVALKEIQIDLACASPMQRLLQGDVGSGKTIIAAFAALQALGAGSQVAVMAPTEILSEQHFNKFINWFGPLDLTVTRLSGSYKRKDREDRYNQIVLGEADIVIGTHALFQEKVKFKNLGLIIVDEQHRFGVGQRLALRNKGLAKAKNFFPHQLMMTATPIPRTLAMSYYADLDVSTIHGLPPGRKPVLMKLVSRDRKQKLVDYIRNVCASGNQVYWVCPLIEDSESTSNKVTPQSAEKTFEELSDLLPDITIGLVHGRLSSDNKTEVMQSFYKKKISLLVATTVIEVGVDVPSATLMVIENSERMGLSQLHQLRGRIGRGASESTCVLLFQEPLSEIAKKRLKIIYENGDGFIVADHDLRIRGPGEFVGVRQSGLPMLKFATLDEDRFLLTEVAKLANELIYLESEVIPRHIKRWLESKLPYLEV
ncbi:MAG: ATP-dependent DNA helicase RecG [Proteobacteria bacterium]|nr:ATP-dependent DNA helicase RecG [Pseudomonadota bacterium]